MFQVEIDTSGLDKLIKNLEDLGDGEHKVPFPEIFPPEFMRKYTDFGTIEKMLEASGYKIEGSKGFDKIPEASWDSFVRQRTRFDGWEDMKAAAGKEWTLKQLDK
jgi:hypothetical protein